MMPGVDSNSKTMQKLRGARSLKEILGIVDGIEKQLSLTDDLADSFLRSVSKTKTVTISLSAGKTIELGDLGTGPSRGSKKFGNAIDLKDFKVPSLDSLIRDSELLADLEQNILHLKSARSILLGSQMSDMSSQPSTVKSLDKLINEAEKTKAKILKAMNNVAKSHRPKEHGTALARLNNFLFKDKRNALDPSSYSKSIIKSFILHPNKDEIWFQSYIYILDMVNQDDYVYDNYAFVLTTKVNMNTGDLDHHMTTLKTDKAPGTFPIGRNPIRTDSELKRTANMLLSVDDVTSRADRKSLGKKTDFLRRNSPLAPRTKGGVATIKDGNRLIPISDGLRVMNDALFVRLVPGLSKDEEKKVAKEVVSMASHALRGERRTRDSLKYKIETSRKGRRWVQIILSSGGAAKGQLTKKKIDHLANQLDLTPDQVQGIRNIAK